MSILVINLIETGRIAFVEELNKERAKVGLLPVKLSDCEIAQKKAELLLKYEEDGHVNITFLNNYSIA